MHAITKRMRMICYQQKSKMAEEGDREMVLANFQVNLSSCYFLCVFTRLTILLLISTQSITGIENLDECITLLDHHNWDLMVRSDFSLSFLDFSAIFLCFVTCTLIYVSIALQILF